jgi:hypothetical protein
MKGISYPQLTPRNRAALFTLKGFIEKQYRDNSRYYQIYQQGRKALNQTTKYRNSVLILRFHSSSRLYHSVRKKENAIIFNIALHSISLTDPYFYNLARLLFSRIAGIKPQREWIEYIRNHEISFLNSRPTDTIPVRKSETDFQGKFFNLMQIYNFLNQLYFDNKLPVTNIGWSRRENFRRLGSYDSRKKLIRVSKILDHSDVPLYVVRGIVYHEMLHMIHPIYQNKNRRIIHGPEFKRDEKKFRQYNALEKWLKNDFPQLAGRGKRISLFQKYFY